MEMETVFVNKNGLKSSDKLFMKALRGEVTARPPIWLMRQAGRYLPEYREVRKNAGSFLDLCYSPELACEVTLQPIRRYGFDAAILFSDILVVPDALGQSVRFVEGEGPQLDPIVDAAGVEALDSRGTDRIFEKVFETVERIGHSLPDETALIGFCGAPWTVATYMVGGKGSPDQAVTRLFAYQYPELFEKLIDLLVSVSFEYLSGQVKAGAEALQIFDSWAGPLPDEQFDRWVIKPTEKLVEDLKKRHPDVPIIGFPRGAGTRYDRYRQMTGVDALGCDTSLPLADMKMLQGSVTVQGNLDPLLLVTGGAALDARVDETLETLGSGPYVFNLGHGILQQTPPDHVAQLVSRIRGDI